MHETHLGKLRHHPFVMEFAPHHVERLAALARDVRFEREQVIFREGDDCSEFYLVVTGLVSLEIVAPGHTFRVQTLFAGDELGWSALLMPSRKPASPTRLVMNAFLPARALSASSNQKPISR